MKFILIVTSPAGAVVKYCDEYVCVCVCVSVLLHVAYGCGLGLLRRRCDILCTSGFVDDIMVFLARGLCPACVNFLKINI